MRTYPTAMQHARRPTRRKRHYRAAGPRSLKFTPRQIEAAHALYWERELSLIQLGEMLYERFGYTNAKRCSEALRLAFARDGLAIRSMSEAKRVDHARRRAAA